jgi:outer membrane protein OmpA-like peptidoglycan-associated protein/opacity protein-like surface antigen
MRGTGAIIVALCLGVSGVSAASAQAKPAVRKLLVPRFDISVGYNNIRANAPPAGCDCFQLNGGYVTAGVHLKDWFSVEGAFTGNHAGRISPLGQDLTLLTYTVGPRISYRYHRLFPFGEVLVGGAHGANSYFPSATSSSQSASSFAFSTGGGLDVNLTSHFAVRAFDLQYLRTFLPNGTNNEQNQLMLSAGLVLKLQGRSKRYPPSAPPPVTPPAPAPPPASVALVCGTNVANVPLGQMVVITGDAKTAPENLAVDYSWSTDGGTIEGSGNTVSINTTGMAVGDYRVKGHASLDSNPSTGAECFAVFRVMAVEPPQSATYVTESDPAARDEKQFHENVKDAYFGVNSAKIRPDTLATINHAAQYLKAHPSIHTIISGWADPRGSMQYNLALGIRRANAVRSALLAAGVSANQLEVISNGKSSQVCTTSDQNCYQQNRRVSFMMRQ